MFKLLRNSYENNPQKHNLMLREGEDSFRPSGDNLLDGEIASVFSPNKKFDKQRTFSKKRKSSNLLNFPSASERKSNKVPTNSLRKPDLIQLSIIYLCS